MKSISFTIFSMMLAVCASIGQINLPDNLLNMTGQDYAAENNLASLLFLLDKDTVKYMTYDDQFHRLTDIDLSHEMTSEYVGDQLIRQSIKRNFDVSVETVYSPEGELLRSHRYGPEYELTEEYYPEHELKMREYIKPDGSCFYTLQHGARQIYHAEEAANGRRKETLEYREDGQQRKLFLEILGQDTLTLRYWEKNHLMVEWSKETGYHMVHTWIDHYDFEKNIWNDKTGTYTYQIQLDSLHYTRQLHNNDQIASTRVLNLPGEHIYASRTLDKNGQLFQLDSTIQREPESGGRIMQERYRFSTNYEKPGWEIERYDDQGKLIFTELRNIDSTFRKSEERIYFKRNSKKGALKKTVTKRFDQRGRKTVRAIPFFQRFKRKRIIGVYEPDHYFGCGSSHYHDHEHRWRDYHGTVDMDWSPIYETLNDEGTAQDYRSLPFPVSAHIINQEENKSLEKFAFDLSHSLIYPAMALDAGIQGRMFVKFELSGNQVDSIYVVKSPHNIFDQGVLKQLEPWKGAVLEDLPEKAELKIVCVDHNGRKSTERFPVKRNLVLMIHYRID